MKKWNTRTLKSWKSIKKEPKHLSMLTCYDYQTAQMLNETDVDILLVGDSLGNVMLGMDTTVEVNTTHMEIFASAVRRGAPNKFIVVDLPFGALTSFDKTIEEGMKLFVNTKAESLKIEGAGEFQLSLIKHFVQIGVPVMGHIGLQPQSVHAQGGYFVHGKDEKRAQELLKEAKSLQEAGVFGLVLECVNEDIAKLITSELDIPTIGIGAGTGTDGQVLVINDLLKYGPNRPPKFCTPIADMYEVRKKLLKEYIAETRS